jgi:hypothetical protein
MDHLRRIGLATATTALLAYTVLARSLGGQTAPPSTAGPDGPRNLGEVFAAAGRARAAGDWAAVRATFRAARAFAPEEPSVLFNLARAEARSGDPAAAIRTLERLQLQGAALDVTTDSAFATLRTSPRFRAVARRIAAGAAPLVRSDTAFGLPGPDFIPEGIAYDPNEDAFYVGSLNQRGIVRVPRAGVPAAWAVSDAEDLGQVLGLRVDPARRTLWAATLAIDSAAPRFLRGTGGWAALRAYELPSGRLIGRWAPDSSGPHLLNDIAVAANGDAYVTDSEGSSTYRLRSGAGALERVYDGRAGAFTYPNGIALSPDGRHLFVAHLEGISVFDVTNPATFRPTRLAAPPGVPTGGIDGLYACGAGLIAVQYLLGFQQITRFVLSADGTRITRTRALERNHPAHEAATTGAPARGAFYYIANAQLDRLQDDGSVRAAERPHPSVVLRLAKACSGP